MKIVNQNEPAEFDPFAADYDQTLDHATSFFGEANSFFASSKVSIVQRLVRKEPKTLLEFGCGTGRNIPFLRTAFPNAAISGCDPSTKSLAVALRENPDVHFLAPQEIPAGTTYDLVLVTNVYHHVQPQDRRAFTHRLFELLAPGGDLFVFEHNPLNPLTRLVVRRIPFDRDAVLLSQSSCVEQLQRGGLRIVRRHYTVFFPHFLHWFRGMERWMGWLPIGAQYVVQATR